MAETVEEASDVSEVSSEEDALDPAFELGFLDFSSLLCPVKSRCDESAAESLITEAKKQTPCVLQISNEFGRLLAWFPESKTLVAANTAELCQAVATKALAESETDDSGSDTDLNVLHLDNGANVKVQRNGLSEHRWVSLQSNGQFIAFWNQSTLALFHISSFFQFNDGINTPCFSVKAPIGFELTNALKWTSANSEGASVLITVAKSNTNELNSQSFYLPLVVDSGNGQIGTESNWVPLNTADDCQNAVCIAMSATHPLFAELQMTDGLVSVFEWNEDHTADCLIFKPQKALDFRLSQFLPTAKNVIGISIEWLTADVLVFVYTTADNPLPSVLALDLNPLIQGQMAADGLGECVLAICDEISMTAVCDEKGVESVQRAVSKSLSESIALFGISYPRLFNYAIVTYKLVSAPIFVRFVTVTEDTCVGVIDFDTELQIPGALYNSAVIGSAVDYCNALPQPNEESERMDAPPIPVALFAGVYGRVLLAFVSNEMSDAKLNAEVMNGSVRPLPPLPQLSRKCAEFREEVLNDQSAADDTSRFRFYGIKPEATEKAEAGASDLPAKYRAFYTWAYTQVYLSKAPENVDKAQKLIEKYGANAQFLKSTFGRLCKNYKVTDDILLALGEVTDEYVAVWRQPSSTPPPEEDSDDDDANSDSTAVIELDDDALANGSGDDAQPQHWGASASSVASEHWGASGDSIERKKKKSVKKRGAVDDTNEDSLADAWSSFAKEKLTFDDDNEADDDSISFPALAESMSSSAVVSPKGSDKRGSSSLEEHRCSQLFGAMQKKKGAIGDVTQFLSNVIEENESVEGLSEDSRSEEEAMSEELSAPTPAPRMPAYTGQLPPAAFDKQVPGHKTAYQFANACKLVAHELEELRHIAFNVKSEKRKVHRRIEDATASISKSVGLVASELQEAVESCTDASVSKSSDSSYIGGAEMVQELVQKLDAMSAETQQLSADFEFAHSQEYVEQQRMRPLSSELKHKKQKLESEFGFVGRQFETVKCKIDDCFETLRKRSNQSADCFAEASAELGIAAPLSRVVKKEHSLAQRWKEAAKAVRQLHTGVAQNRRALNSVCLRAKALLTASETMQRYKGLPGLVRYIANGSAVDEALPAFSQLSLDAADVDEMRDKRETALVREWVGHLQAEERVKQRQAEDRKQKEDVYAAGVLSGIHQQRGGARRKRRVASQSLAALLGTLSLESAKTESESTVGRASVSPRRRRRPLYRMDAAIGGRKFGSEKSHSPLPDSSPFKVLQRSKRGMADVSSAADSSPQLECAFSGFTRSMRDALPAIGESPADLIAQSAKKRTTAKRRQSRLAAMYGGGEDLTEKTDAMEQGFGGGTRIPVELALDVSINESRGESSVLEPRRLSLGGGRHSLSLSMASARKRPFTGWKTRHSQTPGRKAHESSATGRAPDRRRSLLRRRSTDAFARDSPATLRRLRSTSVLLSAQSTATSTFLSPTRTSSRLQKPTAMSKYVPIVSKADDSEDIFTLVGTVKRKFRRKVPKLDFKPPPKPPTPPPMANTPSIAPPLPLAAQMTVPLDIATVQSGADGIGAKKRVKEERKESASSRQPTIKLKLKPAGVLPSKLDFAAFTSPEPPSVSTMAAVSAAGGSQAEDKKEPEPGAASASELKEESAAEKKKDTEDKAKDKKPEDSQWKDSSFSAGFGQLGFGKREDKMEAATGWGVADGWGAPQPGAGVKAEDSETGDWKQVYEKRLVALYTRMAPEKLGNVRKLLEKYAKNPQSIQNTYEAACKKYNITAKPLYAKMEAAASGWSQQPSMSSASGWAQPKAAEGFAEASAIGWPQPKQESANDWGTSLPKKAADDVWGASGKGDSWVQSSAADWGANASSGTQSSATGWGASASLDAGWGGAQATAEPSWAQNPAVKAASAGAGDDPFSSFSGGGFGSF